MRQQLETIFIVNDQKGLPVIYLSQDTCIMSAVYFC